MANISFDSSMFSGKMMVFFILLSLFVFRLSKKMAQSEDMNAFTRLIMYNLMIKLFMSIIIVLFYFNWRRSPQNSIIYSKLNSQRAIKFKNNDNRSAPIRRIQTTNSE